MKFTRYHLLVKFRYCKKATKFGKNLPLFLKNNFVAFTEYLNFVYLGTLDLNRYFRLGQIVIPFLYKQNCIIMSVKIDYRKFRFKVVVIN